MDFNEYNEYLILSTAPESSNDDRLNYRIGGLDLIKELFTKSLRVCSIEVINNYEIYTCDPKTGTSGWDIKLVRSTDKRIKHYPHFDVIISRNDCQPTEDFFLKRDDYEFAEV